MDVNNTNGFIWNLYAITTKTIKMLRYFFKIFLTCASFHEFGSKKENTVQSQFNDTFGLRKRLSLN